MANTVRPLASRILGRNHLEAIKMEVMIEYLNHHTRVADSTNRFFSDEAVFAIHQVQVDYCEGPIPWQKQPS